MLLFFYLCCLRTSYFILKVQLSSCVNEIVRVPHCDRLHLLPGALAECVLSAPNFVLD